MDLLEMMIATTPAVAESGVAVREEDKMDEDSSSSSSSDLSSSLISSVHSDSSSSDESENKEEEKDPMDDAMDIDEKKEDNDDDDVLESSASSGGEDNDDDDDDDDDKKSKSKKAPPADYYKGMHPWRPLGLFCTEKNKDAPYLIMESLQSVSKEPHRMHVARVSATDPFAQLVMSPLYQFRLVLEYNSEDCLYHITELGGPVRFSDAGVVTKFKKSALKKQLDDDDANAADTYIDEHYVETMKTLCTEDMGPKHLEPILRSRIRANSLETMFYRCFVAGPGLTRTWRWSKHAVPIDMHMVRSTTDDPLGMWVKHPLMWSNFTDDARKKRIESWPSRSCVYFEKAQTTTRWDLARERYNTTVRYKQFLSSLVLTEDKKSSEKYTGAQFVAAYSKQKTRATMPVIRVSNVIMALENGRTKGSGRSVLHVRPCAIHLLIEQETHLTVDSPSNLPLAIAETVDDAKCIAIMTDRHSLDPDAKPPSMGEMYGMLHRCPRDWFETHGGVIDAVDIKDSEQRTQFALHMAREIIDERADASMERSRSSAYRVRLDKLMGEITDWLYGRGTPVDGPRITQQQLLDFLVKTRPSPYRYNVDTQILVRVTDVMTAANERRFITGLHTMISTNAKVDFILSPQAAHLAGGSGAVDHLIALVRLYPLMNTVIITPYHKERRVFAMTNAMGNLNNEKATSTIRSLSDAICGLDVFNMNNSEVTQRSTTVIVDAAHLLTATDLAALFETFSSNGITQRIIVTGSVHLCINTSGGGIERGCAFRDLVVSFSDLVRQQDRPNMTPMDEGVLLTVALVQWRTLNQRSIVSFHNERPSKEHVQDMTFAYYHTLMAKSQNYIPYTANANQMQRSGHLHSHFVSDSALSRSYQSAVVNRAPGTHSIDVCTIYEIPWSTFVQITRAEFITALSHGYALAVYMDTGTKNEKVAPFIPTTDVNAINETLRAYFNKGSKLTTRTTAWQLLWQDDFIKSREAQLLQGKK